MKKIKTVWFLNSIIGTAILAPLVFAHSFGPSTPFVLKLGDKFLIALFILILALLVNLVFFLMNAVLIRLGWENNLKKANLLYLLFALIGQFIIGLGFTHFDFTHLLILISYFIPGAVLWNIYIAKRNER